MPRIFVPHKREVKGKETTISSLRSVMKKKDGKERKKRRKETLLLFAGKIEGGRKRVRALASRSRGG